METTAKKVTATAEPKKRNTTQLKKVEANEKAAPTFDDASNFILQVGRKLKIQMKLKTQLSEIQEFKSKNEMDDITFAFNSKKDGYRNELKYFCDDSETAVFFVEQLEEKLLARAAELEAEILKMTNSKIVA